MPDYHTEGTPFNLASKDYPELQEILEERLPLQRSKPSENKFKMHASKTAEIDPVLHMWVSQRQNITGSEMEELRRRVNESGIPTPRLFRGIREIGSSHRVDQSFHESNDLLSWTTSLDAAKRHAGKWGEIMELAPGATGLPLGTDGLDWEQEWIVDGGRVHPTVMSKTALTLATYDKTTFDKTATWHDVQAKAARIRQEGGVRIISTEQPYIAAHVQGDNGVYETSLQRGPSGEIEMWKCSCPWDHYSFGRTGIWKKYEGRMCSHALATQYQAQSEGMFGGKVHEDGQGPEWDTGVTRYDPGKRVLRADSSKMASVQTVPIEQVRFLGLPIEEYNGERGTGEYLDSLVEDIRHNGIKHPLRVVRIKDWSTLVGEENYTGPGRYIIGDGAHRLRAAQTLGLTHVPIEVEASSVARTIQPVAYLSPFVAGITEDNVYEGEQGNKRHITRKVQGTVPISAIADMAGVMGEIPGTHPNRLGQRWEDFKSDISTNGIREPIFITQDYGENPKISEGNHRRDAAAELGLSEVPVEVRYFGQAEQHPNAFKITAHKHTDTLKDKITNALSDDLRKPAYQGNCNPLTGHCYVASEAYYHMAGGRDAGLKPMFIRHEGEPHWFIRDGEGQNIDLTAGQFKTPVPYDQATGKGFLTAGPSARAKTLMDRVNGKTATLGPNINGSGAMLAIRPPQPVCEALVVAGGEEESQLHYTLVYVPDVTEEDMGKLRQVASAIAAISQPFSGRVNGYGQFNNDDEYVLYASLESGEVQDFRQRVVDALDVAGVNYSKDHPGYTPHCTLLYSDHSVTPPELPAEAVDDFDFGSILVARGKDWTFYPFSQNVKTSALNREVLDAVHLWTDIKVNLHGLSAEQLHNGFRYGWYMAQGDETDAALFAGAQRDPEFQRGEHLANVLLAAVDANAIDCHHTLYRAIGLNDTHYPQVLTAAQSGSMTLQPASWSSERNLTNQFGIGQEGHYPHRVIFRLVPGSKAWSVGRASVTGSEREWVVTGGTFTVQDIDIPMIGDDIDRSVVITLSQNTVKTAATHDVSKEKRDNSGEWTQGPAGSGAPKKAPKAGPVKEITKDQARGNSRPVSSQEFQSLADKGKSQLDALLADTRPAHAFEDDDKWKTVKTKAYHATRKSWGGQTINPATGNPVSPAKGYSISIRNPGQPTVAVAPDASRLEFNQAMDKAKADFAEQLAGSKTYLGVFKDDDNNVIDIDPVTIVETPEEVDSLGAYTHAVGGAYDFATGDGYFPPHVDPTKEDKPKSDRVRISPVVSDDDYKGADKVASDLTMANIPKVIQKKILARMTNDVGAAPDVAQANIVAQFERAPAELRDEYANWYYSAHDMSRKLGKENDISPHVVAAVIAAASAGASWYSQSGNKDVAQVTVEEASPANRTAPIDDERREWLNSRLTTERFVKDKQPDGSIVERSIGALTTWQIPKGASLQDVYDKIKGETEDTQNKILGMVIAHKYHFPTGYGYGNFGKSMRMALDNDPTKITTSIAGPKIRSFFNDIENPEGDDVTVDVHMWRSFTNTPASSRQDIAKQYIKLKKNTSKITGSPSYQGASVGAYPIAADVVRAAAEELNEKNGTHYTASQVQAVVWGQQKKEWGVGDIRKLPSIAKGAAVEDGASMHIPVYWGKEEPDDQVELWHLPGEDDDLPEDDDTLDELNLRQEATLHDEPEPALPTTDGELTDDELEPLKAGLGWLAPPEAVVSHMGIDPNVDNAPQANPENAEIAAMAMATLEKMGVKTFTPAEQRELIEEGEGQTALNIASLNLADSHYEQLEAELKKADSTGEQVMWW